MSVWPAESPQNIIMQKRFILGFSGASANFVAWSSEESGDG